MKKFEKPVIEIEKFEYEDVLSESNGDIVTGENETPVIPGGRG